MNSAAKVVIAGIVALAAAQAQAQSKYTRLEDFQRAHQICMLTGEGAAQFTYVMAQRGKLDEIPVKARNAWSPIDDYILNEAKTNLAMYPDAVKFGMMAYNHCWDNHYRLTMEFKATQ